MNLFIIIFILLNYLVLLWVQYATTIVSMNITDIFIKHAALFFTEEERVGENLPDSLIFVFCTFQVNLSGVGDVTLWDFSGQDTYFCVYHQLLTTSANHAIILLVFNLDDSPNVQLRQCSFWLSFIQARIPPTEPLGMHSSNRF